MTKEEKRLYDKERYASIKKDPVLLEKHRSSVRRAALTYYYRNRDLQLQKVKKWRKENPEKRLAQKKRYRTKYPKALSNWYRENPGANTHYINARRSRKFMNGGSHTFEQWKQLVSQHKNKCFYCKNTFEKLTRDHAIPLSRGGTDDISNIVPACKSCNCSKRTQTATEYLARIGAA